MPSRRIQVCQPCVLQRRSISGILFTSWRLEWDGEGFPLITLITQKNKSQHCQFVGITAIKGF